jgi:AcrR family transcriptional regulator
VDSSGVTRQRRGTAVASAVIAATLELLTEHGYDFSVEDVARRARVHKTTIYRRYVSKATLVASAIESLALSEVPLVVTEDPLADLSTLAASVARLVGSAAGTRILRAVVAAAGDDAEVLSVTRRFLAGRFDVALEIVTRAIARGTLRAGVDPLLVWGAIVNPLHVRALLGYPASEETARELVALVLEGARVSSP